MLGRAKNRKNRKKPEGAKRRFALPAINWRYLAYGSAALALIGCGAAAVAWAFNQPIETVALTPSTFFNAASTRPTQDAQVIPSMGRLISAAFARMLRLMAFIARLLAALVCWPRWGFPSLEGQDVFFPPLTPLAFQPLQLLPRRA